MSFGSCKHESELAELLKRGQWPTLATPEMRAHAASCTACRDLVAVTQAFRRERTAAAGEARLEPPGVLWWRAQLRKRDAALRQVSRPLVAAQTFALALGLVAALLFLGLASDARAGWLSLVAGLPSALHIPAMLPEAWQSAGAAWLVLLSIAALALMGGVFVYKASEDQ